MEDIHILLVEDNHGDIHLIEGAFEDRELPGTVHTVQTGDAALDWLHRRDDPPKGPRPDIVLLDLNLPATSGLTLLDDLKSDPRLKRVPVIVLTGSQSDDDLLEAYEAGANACLRKPVDPDEFADRIQSLAEFWGSTVALPSPSDPPDAP